MDFPRQPAEATVEVIISWHLHLLQTFRVIVCRPGKQRNILYPGLLSCSGQIGDSAEDLLRDVDGWAHSARRWVSDTRMRLWKRTRVIPGHLHTAWDSAAALRLFLYLHSSLLPRLPAVHLGFSFFISWTAQHLPSNRQRAVTRRKIPISVVVNTVNMVLALVPTRVQSQTKFYFYRRFKTNFFDHSAVQALLHKWMNKIS